MRRIWKKKACSLKEKNTGERKREKTQAGKIGEREGRRRREGGGVSEKG